MVRFTDRRDALQYLRADDIAIRIVRITEETAEPDGAFSIAWIKAASTAGVNEKSSASDR